MIIDQAKYLTIKQLTMNVIYKILMQYHKHIEKSHQYRILFDEN